MKRITAKNLERLAGYIVNEIGGQADIEPGIAYAQKLAK